MEKTIIFMDFCGDKNNRLQWMFMEKFNFHAYLQKKLTIVDFFEKKKSIIMHQELHQACRSKAKAPMQKINVHFYN